MTSTLRTITTSRGSTSKVAQMRRGQNAPSITTTSSSIGRIGSLTILIFRQRIMQLKYSIHIENGHGSGKNGLSKTTKKNRGGLITHNRR